MALTEKRTEAEHLYVSTSLSISAIAEALGVDAGTVYRWRSEAARAGEGQDWDYRRQVQALSFDKLKSVFREAIRSAINKIEEDPTLLLNPKFADALSKIIKSLERIDPRASHFGAIEDLIKVTSQWLTEHEPDIKARLDPYWDSIFQELVNYSTKRLF
jgi:transposase-like protein